MLFRSLGGHTETMAPWILQLGSIAAVVFSAVLIWVALGLAYNRFALDRNNN